MNGSSTRGHFLAGLLGMLLVGLLLACGGTGGGGGQSGVPGKDSYASPQEMLPAFDAVYKTGNSMGASGQPTESAVCVKGDKAAVYIKNHLLGTRWYKWTNETLATLEKAGGSSDSEAKLARVSYDFDGSTVSYKVSVPMIEGAKKERIPVERKGQYKLTEADRVK